jgi:hypothetical protein
MLSNLDGAMTYLPLVTLLVPLTLGIVLYKQPIQVKE